MSHSQRLQPKRQIKMRSGMLGGEKPMVCVPLVGNSRDAIVAEAENIPAIAPDIIELRVDAWDFIEDTQTSLEMIREVREIVGEIPIILTCRGDWEGGIKYVGDEAKFSLYDEAVKEGLVDLIDVELKYGEEKIKEILDKLEGTSTSLIVSFHDFDSTPSREELVSIMGREITAGAHVAKVAAMPQSEEDVLAVLSATLEIRREFPSVPIITMSMGATGAVSRLVGGLFGSDLTFAVGSKESAPGQIPVADLKQCFKVIYAD